MRCPHLRETGARFCGAAASRKLIVRTQTRADTERCSTADWLRCPLLQGRKALEAGLPSCPFLEKSQVQFCAAAPFTKYLPSCEAGHSPCVSRAHRYCDHFLAPARGDMDSLPAGGPSDVENVEGVPIRRRLSYSPNHMWIDIWEGSPCHIGMDGFAARMFGSVDGLRYLSISGLHNPTVVLTAGGLDLPMVFPHRVRIMRTNISLRLHPERVAADPYGMGWMFAGATGFDPDRPGRVALLSGDRARPWIEHELRRVAALLPGLAPDSGGEPAPGESPPAGPLQGILPRLRRDERLLLFNEFFAPHVTWQHSDYGEINPS